MNAWKTVFEQARRIVASSHTIEQVLEQAIAAARRDPVVFDEPGYWDRATEEDLHATFQILRDWATEGLGKLVWPAGVGVLILDLGDCPETFSLYQPGGQSLLSEKKLEQILQPTLIAAEDFEKCFREPVEDPFALLFGDRNELTDRTVWELPDSILRWSGDMFSGNNGYFLWLTVGAFALLQSLQAYRVPDAVAGRTGKLYIVIGFEELFSHFATIANGKLVVPSASN